MTSTLSKAPTSHFPSHSEPRVWFITSAASPIGISTAREVLAHGDTVVAGDDTVYSRKEDPTRLAELAALSDDAENEGWQDRLKIIKLVSRCEAPFSVASEFAYQLKLIYLRRQKKSKSLPDCRSGSAGSIWADRCTLLLL